MARAKAKPKVVEPEAVVGAYCICKYANLTDANGDVVVGRIMGFGTKLNLENKEVPCVYLQDLLSGEECEKEVPVFRQRNYVVAELYAERLVSLNEVSLPLVEAMKNEDGSPVHERYGQQQKAAKRLVREEAVRIYKCLKAGEPTGYEPNQQLQLVS